MTNDKKEFSRCCTEQIYCYIYGATRKGLLASENKFLSSNIQSGSMAKTTALIERDKATIYIYIYI